MMLPDNPGIKSITINGKKIINEKLIANNWLFNLGRVEAITIMEGMWTSAKQAEKNGIVEFMRILRNMPSFDTIEFNAEDICRSGLVKEYIIAKLQMGI